LRGCDYPEALRRETESQFPGCIIIEGPMINQALLGRESERPQRAKEKKIKKKKEKWEVPGLRWSRST
jgi:hypothetical protein